ncbi:pyridoxamine 5'-phosphate oxidase family protein [Nocardia transvalensis]|uniref:pyridoxamine 5'-phosphate oxidase family protein n=1 Tax=Nocardia transvalensis TaxID=37333 RepID=UPI001892FD9F|nr:pyridoxamine 5'-phosphate oxidase family protein [Nocardia transvalensis]MBF6331231.1 pyridoxamine 5'-phosphate oxidase family protein [Nocardia transvalensis]
MAIDPDVAKVLANVRVMELSTVTKKGGLSTKPMSAVWLPETERIIMTTPLAYPQKVYNIRRDGRVGLFYSDFTGTDLAGAEAVLVQGTAQAPETVAAPQDIPEFWQNVFRRVPEASPDFGSEEYRTAMEWYYWRLPIVVTPERVHVADAVDAGGAWEPPLPETAAMTVRIADALARYPTAVLCSRDASGYPFSARVTVAQDGAGRLRVEPRQPFSGLPGPANLLWHRHNGRSGEMHSLLVDGTLTQDGSAWAFLPERIPGQLASGRDESSYEAWIADGRQRTHQYLAKRGLRPPEIDWAALTAFAQS